MPEAWQVREYQRQRLIEKLMKKTWEFEENDRKVRYDLAISILQFLKDREIAHVIEPFPLNAVRRIAAEFFRSEIWKSILQFSRTQEECDYLIGKYLEKVIGEVLHPFNSKMLRQEVHEPEKIYGARTMAEIPLPEENQD